MQGRPLAGCGTAWRDSTAYGACPSGRLPPGHAPTPSLPCPTYTTPPRTHLQHAHEGLELQLLCGAPLLRATGRCCSSAPPLCRWVHGLLLLLPPYLHLQLQGARVSRHACRDQPGRRHHHLRLAPGSGPDPHRRARRRSHLLRVKEKVANTSIPVQYGECTMPYANSYYCHAPPSSRWPTDLPGQCLLQYQVAEACTHARANRIDGNS